MLVLNSPKPTWELILHSLKALPSDRVIVLTLPSGEPPKDIQRVLSDYEQSASDAYSREVHANQYRWRRIILRFLLAKVIGCEPPEVVVDLGTLGKPSNPQLGFNLAFSGDRVGYIWGPKGKSLGIDLEVPSSRKADRYWAVAERFFSPEERKWLVNQEDKGGWSTFVDSFYTLWCRKEALVKAFGVSIGSHADICPVLGDGSGDFFVNWEGLRWELTDLEVPGLYGAKALQI